MAYPSRIYLAVQQFGLAIIFREKAEPSTPIPRHKFRFSPLEYPSITRSIEEGRDKERCQDLIELALSINMQGIFDEQHLQREGRTISGPVHSYEYQRKGYERESYVAMSKDGRLLSVGDWKSRTVGVCRGSRRNKNKNVEDK
ncbi:hypothetical protein EMPG_15039 [Blastomyces silverae]|uniref:Uncharacterized protein n=1 Tax=Blastomyces silverae TaxID=2060906 RepID=A0A0H1BDW8_9EURO|nr:hypothetical protein EMPG_15039 [Blastomyces silverae]